MAPGCVGNGRTTQHTGNFFNALIAAKGAIMRERYITSL
jgi:hypothetical protein